MFFTKLTILRWQIVIPFEAGSAMESASIHQPQTLSMKSYLDRPKGNYHKIGKRNLQKVKTQVRTLRTKFRNYRACKSSSDCIIIEDAT